MKSLSQAYDKSDLDHAETKTAKSLRPIGCSRVLAMTSAFPRDCPMLFPDFVQYPYGDILLIANSVSDVRNVLGFGAGKFDTLGRAL